MLIMYFFHQVTYPAGQKVIAAEYLRFDALKCQFGELDLADYAGQEVTLSIVVGTSESEPQPIGVFSSDCMSCDDTTDMGAVERNVSSNCIFSHFLLHPSLELELSSY